MGDRQQEHLAAVIRIARAEAQASHWPDLCKAMRVAAGMTQEQVAAALEITPQTVSNYECGRSTPWGKSAVAYVEFLESAVTSARATRADVIREWEGIRYAGRLVTHRRKRELQAAAAEQLPLDDHDGAGPARLIAASAHKESKP